MQCHRAPVLAWKYMKAQALAAEFAHWLFSSPSEKLFSEQCVLEIESRGALHVRVQLVKMQMSQWKSTCTLVSSSYLPSREETETQKSKQSPAPISSFQVL